MANKKHLLEFLKSNEPAWKEENHPELRQGAVEWVRKLRKESDLASNRRARGKSAPKPLSKRLK